MTNTPENKYGYVLGIFSGIFGCGMVLLGIVFFIGSLYQYLRSGDMTFYTLAKLVRDLGGSFYGWRGLESILEVIPIFLVLIVLGIGMILVTCSGNTELIECSLGCLALPFVPVLIYVISTIFKAC